MWRYYQHDDIAGWVNMIKNILIKRCAVGVEKLENNTSKNAVSWSKMVNEKIFVVERDIVRVLFSHAPWVESAVVNWIEQLLCELGRTVDGKEIKNSKFKFIFDERQKMVKFYDRSKLVYQFDNGGTPQNEELRNIYLSLGDDTRSYEVWQNSALSKVRGALNKIDRIVLMCERKMNGVWNEDWWRGAQKDRFAIESILNWFTTDEKAVLVGHLLNEWYSKDDVLWMNRKWLKQVAQSKLALVQEGDRK
jgi:hypothetical protein